MSRGAIRTFIRLKPIDPLNDPRNVVDIEHIISFHLYGWGKNENKQTEIFLSSGHGYVSNETPEEFEARLKSLMHNIIFEEDK